MTCHEQWFLARGEAAVEFPDATVQRKIEIQTVLTDYLECHLMVRLSLKAPIQKFRPLSSRKFWNFPKISKFRVWVNNLGRGFWLMKKIVMFQFLQNVRTRQWAIYRRFPVKDLLKRSLIFRKNLIPLLIYRSQRKERRQHYRGRVRKQR